MGSVAEYFTDGLWRNGIAVVPLVLMVALMCRLSRGRPATRHGLWLFVILWLVVPPLAPTLDAGFLTAPTLEDESSLDAIPAATRLVEPPKAPKESLQAPTPPRTVARTELGPPTRLASEADSVGLLSDLGGSRQGPTEALEATIPPADPDPPNDRPVANSARPLVIAYPGPEETPRQPIHAHGLFQLNVEPRPPGRAAARKPDSESALKRVASGASPIGLSPDRRSFPNDTPAPPMVTDESARTVERESTTGPAQTWGLSRLFETFGARWLIGLIGVRDALGRLPPMPVSIWAAGLVLIVGLQTLRFARFRGLLARAVPASGRIIAEVRLAADSIGLRSIPETMVIEERVSPMIWCGRRTRLLLPAGLWSQLDEVGRQAVLLHELAHLRRRDHWVRWADAFIGGLYWWHPVVWWVRGRLREEAENCCDAWVTWLLPRGRRAYAEALLTTRQYLGTSRPAATVAAVGMFTGRARRFARRLTMVMTQKVTPRISISGLAMAATLAAAGWLTTPARSCPPADAEAPSATTPTQPPTAEAPSAVMVAPAAPVAATSPQPRAMLAATAPLPPITPMAGGLMILPSVQGPPRRGGDDLEDRLERLERTLERLSERLERLDGHAPPRPRQPERPTAPPTPRADGAEVSRVYRLSDGKLEMLSALMVRDDVPVRVRPVEGGLEVFGTEGQQVAFGAFVDMLETPDEVRGYRLSPGKLELLTELMVRDDVPILVTPGSDELKVHGGGAVQAVFEAFVGMIEPGAAVHREKQVGKVKQIDRERKVKAEKEDKVRLKEEIKARSKLGRERTRAAAEATREVMKLLEEAQNNVAQGAGEARAAYVEAIAQAKAALREFRDGYSDLRSEVRGNIRSELRQRASDVGSAAERLEEEAEALEEKAEAMRQKAEQLRRKAELGKGGGDPASLAAEAAELDAQAEWIEQNSVAMLEKVDAFEQLADSLTEMVDQDEDSAVELEEAEEHEHEEAEADEEADIEEEDAVDEEYSGVK